MDLCSGSYFPVFFGSVLVVVLSAHWWLGGGRCNSLPVSSDKAVLITGCDSGLGFQSALLLDRLGYFVFAGCFNSDNDGARTLRQQASRRLVILELDVTDDGKVVGAKDVVEMMLLSLKFKGLWALINNAGVYVVGELEWITLEQCQRQVEVNLLGVIRMIKVFLPLVKEAKGRIINVSSFSGRIGIPYRTVYCATKFGVEGLSDALRSEVSKYHVHVVVVEPGNHSRLTNICGNQLTDAEAMWREMEPKSKRANGENFWKFQQHAGIEAARGPSTYFDTTVLSDIARAVGSKVPNRRYISGTWWDVNTFNVCRQLPDVLLDWLFQKYSMVD